VPTVVASSSGGVPEKIVIIASTIAALIGAAALLSWALDIRLLRGATALRYGMSPGTAVAVLLASFALRASAIPTLPWLRWAGIAAAAGTTLLAGAAFGAYTVGWDTSGLDLLFFAEKVSRPGEAVPVGRMAVNTALALGLLGLALMVLLVGGNRPRLSRVRWRHALVTALAGTALSVGFVAAIGYLHGMAGLYALRGLSAMAPNTAAAIVLLAVGVLFARPGRGLSGIITGGDAGAVLVRRLLPVVIIAPVGIGALRVLAVDAGLFEATTATIVRTLVEVVLLLGIVLITAKRLGAVDTDRARGYVAEREARARAEQLQELSALLSAARTPRDVARVTLEAGCAALGLRLGSVFVVTDSEQPRDTLSLVHAVGYDAATVRAWSSIPNTPDTLAGDAVARREPVVVGRRSELLEHYPALRPLVETTAYCGGAVFPLLSGTEAGAGAGDDTVIGMIGFDFDEERDVDDADRRFLGALAQLCAQALDRARLFEAEQAAREAAVAERRRLMLILDTLPVGVVVVDATAGVVHVNPASDSILGNSLEPVASLADYTTYGGGLHADGRPYAPKDYPIARALLDGEVVHQELTRYRRGDGREILASISAAPVRDDDGEIAFAVAALEDVSDREAARVAAVEANRVKSQFLANMSHELRTPLNAIAGHVQLMELGIHGPVTDAQLHALGRVQKAGQHLLSLINDVLNYARLEAGRVEFEMRPTSLVNTVRDVLQIVEAQAQLKGLELHIVLPEQPGGDDEPVFVWADADKLAQALFNLLSNAIKFTPAQLSTGEPGRITVRLPGPNATAEVAQLFVEDSGIGIPEELQEAIFEPFVQVRPGYTREYQGAGLGLAISRDLLRGMDGELQVRSTPGDGSTFIMTLKLASREALT
jgi:PAS domain S-box-containing protein